MSSSESTRSEDQEETTSGGKENNANNKFVHLLKSYKVLFNKSQVPKIKKAKDKAILKVQLDYIKIFGKEITVKQLKKKIQNIKNELKKKTDKNATGNKKIILKDWEKCFLELMDVGDNPVFNKVPGSQKIGFTDDTSDDIEPIKNIPVAVPSPRPPLPKRIKTKVEFAETEETKGLSTSELQRLVLLEQLKLIRMQADKEK